jgi:predicted transcriptional regulator
MSEDAADPPRRGRTRQPPRARGATNAPDALEAAYAILAFTMNRCVIDQMLRSARQFGGDYERLVLWGVLAHLNVAPLMPPGSLPSWVLDADGRVPGVAERMRPVRTSDLAQITGIPRETVRRKLGALERDGWIGRSDAGWLLDVERLDPEVRAFTLQSIRNFLQAARTMEAAIADVAAGTVGGSRSAGRDAMSPTAHTMGSRRGRPAPRRG